MAPRAKSRKTLKPPESFFGFHCLVAFFIRILGIIWANYHDKIFKLPYTDVDYRVFTDAARHMADGRSPYERHTYRYTPLLALLMTPNVLVHPDCGKLLFCFVDILVAVLIKKILLRRRWDQTTCDLSALLWLYNPLTIVVSTRGNADSLAVLLVLWTVCLLQQDRCVAAGLVHGLSVHFRLYPLVFSLPMYLSLRNQGKDASWFWPSIKQARLVLACALSLFDLTFVCYKIFGYRFLHESLIYHLMRKDLRHNFSVYFYSMYLSGNEVPTILEKLLTFLPQLLILLVLAVTYSSKAKLPFALFAQAVVMVVYNPVVTSQYFFWFLSLLPICLPDLRMSLQRFVALVAAWILSQCLWLLAAYRLEFKGLDSFDYIWVASLFFFSVNIKILVDIVSSYSCNL